MKEENVVINHSINPEMRNMDNERKRASFNPRELTYLLDGKDETLRRVNYRNNNNKEST